ncbi:hypothetical protein ACFV4N_38075 [Actinosynnema sp. NPDC059797]
MTRSDHSDRGSTRRRTASTHPGPTRPGGRRPVERRAWPTAPTTTRVSPGKPATGSRSRGPSATPTPATVWTLGPTAIDLNTTWPAPLVERVVTSFSRPAARVVLLASPNPDDSDRALVPAGPDGTVDHTPAGDPDPELADAVHTVERLARAARVARIPAGTTAPDPTSRPFRAGRVGDHDPAPATAPSTFRATGEASATNAQPDTVDSADLVIGSLPPQHHDDHAADRIALFAARALRVGGILVVLTHCDWSAGELTDPTGAAVTAGQNADLLYLQHIVAVHAPLRDGRFHPVDTRQELPASHRRIHSDVLVFAQPHDHRPPADNTAPHRGDHR